MAIGKKVVGSLILVAILWAGVTAYISGSTKKHLNNYINKSNKIYTNNGMKMSLLSFEKGFLNSKAKVSIEFIEPDMKKELEAIFKLPMVMEYNIENGPLFFQNGLAMGASRINYRVNVNELLVNDVELKRFIKEDIILVSNMCVDFSNHITYIANSEQIVADVEGDIFTIAPFTITSKMNMDTFVSNFKMFSKSIKGELENTGKIKLENITIDAEITKFFNNDFYLDKFAFAVEKLNVNNPSFPQEIKDASFKMLLNIEQNESKTVNMNFGFNLNVGETKLPVEYNFLKKLDFNYGINHIKADVIFAFQDAMKGVQLQQQKVLQQFSSATNQEEEMKAMEALEKMQTIIQDKIALLFSELLVKEKTTFNLKALLTDHSNVQSSAKLDLSYVGDEVLPKTLTELEAQLLNWLKLNISVDLAKSLVVKLPKETQGAIAMYTVLGMIQNNKSSYSFNVDYLPKKLILNGQDRSDMLISIEMALQDGM